MSVTIRLAKFGKRNAPTFKVVASQTRDKRNGKFLDILGYYNPQNTPAEFSIDQERFDYWKNNGALVTKAVDSLVAGTYEFEKYDPKARAAAAKAATENKKAEDAAAIEAAKAKNADVTEATQIEEEPAQKTPQEEN